MPFFFLHRRPYGSGSMPAVGSSLLGAGLLCILFGLAIIAAPELLAYFVASFLLLIGCTLVGIWWRMR